MVKSLDFFYMQSFLSMFINGSNLTYLFPTCSPLISLLNLIDLAKILVLCLIRVDS